MCSRNFLIILFTLFSLHTFSQKKTTYLKDGNKDFAKQNYVDAEANFRSEQSRAEDKTVAAYNLGNSIYRQNSFEESKYAYQKALEKATNKAEKHKIYHNLGNVLMKEKNYQGAVEAYKNALRNNPYDEESRYNFVVAKDMLDKNPPPPDENQNQDNQENQDQEQDQQNKQDQKNDNQDQKDNQENQDQGDNQENQDNQDQGDKEDKKDQQGQGNQDQKPQGGQNGMSKQRLENLLDAVENQEKGIQKKVQINQEQKEKKGQVQQREKNW